MIIITLIVIMIIIKKTETDFVFDKGRTLLRNSIEFVL